MLKADRTALGLLEAKVAQGIPYEQAFAQYMTNASIAAKEYEITTKGASGSTDVFVAKQKTAQAELKATTTAANGASIAMKALSIAGNMLIMWGISKVIQIASEKFDELAHSVENCKERVDNLLSSYDSAISSANDNAKRIEEMADDYETLSKGVNNLGENVSLTSDEYEKYNDLVNEIAEMFPTLVQGYTDEGNAILNLKGNVEELRDAYKEAQKEAYNLLIVSGEDSDGNDIIKQWNDTRDTGFWADALDLGAEDIGGGISVSDALDQLKAIQKMTADQYREIKRIVGSGTREEIAGLTDVQKDIGYGSYLYKVLGLDSDVSNEEFANIQKQAKALVQTYNAEIESALSDVKTLANAYLMTNEDYDKLDAQSKTAASMIVNSLNESIANGFSSKEDVAVYVDSIVQAISSNDDAKEALTKLFTLDTSNMSISEIKSQVDSYIDVVAKALNENPVELKARLGFEDSNTEPLVNKVKGFLKDEFDNKVEELTPEDLDIASKLEIPKGTLLSWDELNTKIAEYKESLKDTDKTNILSISETISQLNTQLRPAFDSLSKAWKEIFTIEDGQEIFSLDSVDTDMLYSIQETISKLNELDEVSIDTRSYENLAKVLTNANSSAEDVKKSFNAFATSIVDGVAVTKEFNESTKDTCVKLLEEMGIVNADEIVIQKLNQAKLNHKIASMDFSQTTADEIRELVSYGESLNLTKQQVFGLYIQQLQLNNNPIQAKNSIIQLYSLTKVGTETANALLDVYKMMDLISKGYQALENGELSEAQARVTELEISKLENKINKRLSDMVQDVDVNWDGLYPDKEETKSSAKDTTESFDWIERAVESLQNRFNSLQKIVDSTFTTTAEKAKALSDQLGLINKEIELQQYAYEEYMAKAESIGLSDNYKNLVQNGAINIEDITDKDLQSAISKYQEYYDKAQDTLEEINSLHEEAMQKHVDCYELEADELKSKLDSQSITEKQYIDDMLVLWEKYYADQVELAEVAKEKKLELLDEEKSYLQSVANAATTLLDNQIDDLEDQKDSAVKVYEDQIEVLENLKKPLQDQLDMMEKARDKEEKILAIQKAQYELRRVENQRSQLKYVDGQMVYTADNKAIKDAQNNLDDAEFELAKFKIQEQIDAYDKQIEKLNELIDQTEKYYDAQIDGLNKYKYEWQKALDFEELAVNMKNFTDMFGENSIGKLLSGDISLIKDWKQSYLDTLKDIDITSNGTIGEITKQFADLAGIDLSNTSAQTQDIASQFDILGESVHAVTSSISNPDATENEEDINSLTSAIQTSYSAASEAIPAQTDMMISYADSVRNVTSEVNNLISAIERLSSMSITFPSLSGNAYANGTRNAEKGLALIGEEKPELVVTNDDKVLVAEKPTLVNMEGGEKVFNGDETKNLFETKSIRQLRPEDSPILHKISQMNPDEIMAKFGINSAMPVRSTVFDTAKSIANSNMVNNNNKPSLTVNGGINVTCPGVNSKEVMNQVSTALHKEIGGIYLDALQDANITR